MTKIKDNQWITFSDAFDMGIGYKYNGEITLDFHVATITNISDAGGATGGDYCHKMTSVKLKNPIRRPFRKGDELEFGIHDIQQNVSGIASVCPYFRFMESNLARDGKFEKVQINNFQEHELMLMDAREEAHTRGSKLFFESWNEAKEGRNILK